MAKKTATVTFEIECEVDSKYFGVPAFFDDEQQAFWYLHFDEEKFTYCGRTGEMGMGCEGCPFCKRFVSETVED